MARTLRRVRAALALLALQATVLSVQADASPAALPPPPAAPSAAGTAATASATAAATAPLSVPGACVDGGGVSWRTKVVWGPTYRSADGTTRVQVDVAGWTTQRSGVLRTDSLVRTYDGTGRLLQSLARTAGIDYRSATVYAARNPLNPPSAPGRTRITVSTGVDGDGRANCVTTFRQPSGPVLAAAGDIACAPASVVGTACRHKAVSDKILAGGVTTVLALGDIQYPNGTLPAFRGSFDPTWGRFKPWIRPVPGNHEYGTAGAAGYFDYFGAAAGARARGYYSFDVGTWHVVALNSERDLAPTGAQLAWLRADLAAHPARCVAAFWHKPRWSSGGHGDNVAMAPFFRALYEHRAELVLSGHDHDYERFVPLDPNGVRDNARGVVQIVSGAGGRSLRPVTGRATTAARDATSYGYSRLALNADSVDVSFVPAVGSYRDSTRIACR